MKLVVVAVAKKKKSLLVPEKKLKNFGEITKVAVSNDDYFRKKNEF